MSGHVFHPGHSELHGITVVIETRGPRTFVGRFDREDERGIHLLDVGVHDERGASLSKMDYLERTSKFGVRTDHKHLVVPSEEIAQISRLADLA
jgi:hypothetical protein